MSGRFLRRLTGFPTLSPKAVQEPRRKRGTTVRAYRGMRVGV